MHSYQVALSFAGEQRSLVAAVAKRLASSLGRDQVFYDRFHEAELARPDLDVYLQRIYHDRAQLVVVFLGADYEHKEWCGLEWRAVRDLIKQKKSEIMLVRADDGMVPGVFGIDGYIDAREHEPRRIAELILERLRLLKPASAVLRCTADRTWPSGVTVVPKPPPHYLTRHEEMRALKAKLLTRSAARVGITAPRQAVGVQGMGGIGKSVLAAALAVDREVTAAFPDGVFWVAVGQRADLVQLQVELAAAAGEEKSVIQSRHQGKLVLSRLFADRRILLVLDDIWTLEDATAFDVLGSDSCLLVTTRDAGLLVALGAQEYTVEVLSRHQAQVLLADWAGQHVSDLPPIARRVARECGYLPLALAMIGAMVRHRAGGWDDAMERLEKADLDRFRRNFPDYPYPDLLRAIEVSVEALESGERERYLELAVVPEEAAVPESVLETLWAAAGLEAVDTRDLCAKLVARSLLKRDHEGRLLLHDLQADYLRHEAADLKRLHCRLVEAYAASCPRGFHQGPDDGYFFQHLPLHLYRSGRCARLHDLLLDYRWLEAKLAATNINSVLADFDIQSHDRHLHVVQSALRLSAHVLAERPEELAGQLLGRLLGQAERRYEDLLRRAQTSAWIRPLSASLTPPGGPLVRTLGPFSRGVNGLAALPDGRFIFSFYDGAVQIGDPNSGQIVEALPRYLGRTIVAVLLESRVVSAADETLQIWDLASGKCLRTLEGHLDMVAAAAVLPDGRIVSASLDHTLRVWGLTCDDACQTLKGHSAPVNTVAVRPDGRIISGSGDHTLIAWDLTSKRCKVLRGHSDRVYAVAVLPDGRVVSGSEDHTLRVWDIDSGEALQVVEGHSAPVTAVVALPVGHVVSGCEDGTLRLWDLNSGETLQTLFGHSEGVLAVTILADGRMVSASNESTLRVWDLSYNRRFEVSQRHASWVRAIESLPDGRIVSASEDGTLRLWHGTTGQVLTTIVKISRPIQAVTVLARSLLAYASNSTIYVCELASGRILRVLTGLIEAAVALAVLPHGFLVSASDDLLWLWDLSSGKTLTTIRAHLEPIIAIAMLPNGTLVSASDDCTLRVWNLASERRLQSLRGHRERVTTVAALPDGRVVSGSDDCFLRIWDVTSGKTIQILSGHSMPILAVAALRDGRVVSASLDGSLRIWNPVTGRTMARFTPDAPPTALTILPRSGRLAAGDAIGGVHLLSLKAAASVAGPGVHSV